MNKKIIFLFALLGLLIYLGITYSNGPQQKGQQMLEFKEGDTYQEDWQQVEKFAQQRLPRSALEVVDKIYQKAKKADNAPQMIKALLHQMRFQQAYEEEALIKNIQQIEKEIEESR
ncbi:hypothetical protein GWN26_03025, partial [Candidatus Saccharibacteria bacterium]|nr:hypothetical protein [Candidatus Saccharibacteria bacterium]NIW78438.1 hypothetical protein [Calditrichia bacterium]